MLQYLITSLTVPLSPLQQPDAEVTPELRQRDTGVTEGESAPREVASPSPLLAIWIRGMTNSTTHPDKHPQSKSANYRVAVRQHRVEIAKS